MGNIIPPLKSAVITLGGKGTRLSKLTANIPKPLYPIEGMHTLERAINILSYQGIKKFIWILNYKSEMFVDDSKKLAKKYDISISIFKEQFFAGEAGSLFNILDKLDQNFLFLNGDIIFDIDIKRLYNFHTLNKADITFVTHLTNHPEDSDCVSETSALTINSFKLKEDNQSTNNYFLGNAGLAVISKKLIEIIKDKQNKTKKELSLFRDFIIFAHQLGLNVFSYNTSEYLKDMGTTKRFNVIENDLSSGLVENSSYRKTQNALFLDRDNTLIQCNEGEYIISGSDIKIFEERIKKIAILSSEYNLVILVTNQPQIAMGKISFQEVININSRIILMCQELGLNIACVYICPHHPSKGFKNEVSFLKTSCFCRKPYPGLFLEASFKRNISLKDSLLIGDSWRDKLAAENTNMKFKWVQDL